MSRGERRRAGARKEGKLVADNILSDIMAVVDIHSSGDSVACPAWLCCSRVELEQLHREVEEFTELINNLKVEEKNDIQPCGTTHKKV